MPFAFRILKAQPASVGSPAVSYTVPGAPVTQAIVTNIRMYNSSSVAANFDILVRPAGGSPYKVAASVTAATSSTTVYSTELTLGTTDVLDINVSGNALECLICGVERM